MSRLTISNALMATSIMATAAALGPVAHSQVATTEPAVPPVHCSLETLEGTYAFAGTGTQYGIPYSASGREAYDGKGHLKYYELWSDGTTTKTYAGTGTYTMSSNCVATVIYDNNPATETWTYFLAPDGSVFYFNNTQNIGKVTGGHEDRISKSLLF